MTRDNPFLLQIRTEIERLLDLVSARNPHAPSPTSPLGLLVGLSGGADSTALLLAATAWRDHGGGPVEAAHVNHGLRGKAADKDEAFCAKLCDRLGVVMHLARSDTRQMAKDQAMSLEEAARFERMGFFDQLLVGRPSLQACATAHHQDDQLETLVMRFFRGAGAEGMRGIRPVSGRIIHPLLVTDRDGITSFLRGIGQDWREDSTNTDGSNVRGRIRHELLPLARDILGPGVDSAPLRLSELLTADAAVLEATARVLMEEMQAVGRGLAVKSLVEMPQPLASRVVRLHLRDEHDLGSNLARTHIDRLLDWLPESRSGAEIDLVDGWCARRDFDRLVFTSPYGDEEMAPDTDFRILVKAAVAEEVESPEPEQGHEVPPSGQWRLTLPPEALRGDPRLRPWAAGDRLVPFGMDGSKKVSDILRESRVPVADRPDVMLVEDDDGPLWLVGLVRAERTRLLPSTATAVTLLIRRESV